MKDFEISSAAVHQKVKKAKTLKDVLDMFRKKDITLTDYLNLMLCEKDLIVAEVQRDSGVKKSYIHQIFEGKKNPSRNVLLAIAFGLHLNEIETQRLLRLGGHSELYARRKSDAIILFCIDHGYSLDETDDVLYDNELPTINPNH